MALKFRDEDDEAVEWLDDVGDGQFALAALSLDIAVGSSASSRTSGWYCSRWRLFLKLMTSWNRLKVSKGSSSSRKKVFRMTAAT